MNVEEIIKTDKKLPLESRSLIHITLVANKLSEAMNTTLKPFDISGPQFNVLRILRGQQGRATNLFAINERMVTKMSNTTRLVDKLMGKAYVDRKICPSNRRKVEIHITEKGLEALAEIDKAVTRSQKEMLAKFSPEELEQLNRLLDKF